VAALWQLAQRGPEAGSTASTVAQCLTDRRPGICAEAARTLAELGPAAEIAIPDLIDVMAHPDDEVRMAAAYALGKLHLQPELVVPELAEHLNDPGVLETAAWALAQFGADAQPALPRLLARLKGELGRGHGAIDFLVYAVRAISPAAEAEFQQMIESCDSDLQQQAGELIPEDGPMIPNPPGRSSMWFWET
jgi:HEAT repeat protein